VRGGWAAAGTGCVRDACWRGGGDRAGLDVLSHHPDDSPDGCGHFETVLFGAGARAHR